MRFWEAAAKYEERRRRALKECQAGLEELLTALCPELAPVRIGLGQIDATALLAWEQDWRPLHRGGPGGWNWRAERARMENEPDRFELAVWGNGQLCGLAIGRPNSRKTILNLHLLEGNPAENHPLKGAIRFVAVDAALRYGDILTVNELRLRDPLPGMVPYYEAMGFRLEGLRDTPPYCSMRLR